MKWVPTHVMLLRLAMHFPVFRRRDDIALKAQESGEEGYHGRILRVLWIPGGLDFQGVCEKIPLPVGVGVFQFLRPVGGRSQELLHVLYIVSEQCRLGWPENIPQPNSTSLIRLVSWAAVIALIRLPASAMLLFSLSISKIGI